MKLNIVLIEPEIPQNTGNIARSCVLTGSTLHLIKPLGFSVDDRYLKRAGLDYWKLLDVKYYNNIEDFLFKNKNGNFYFATTKTKKIYSEMTYKDNDFFIFGKESKGIDEKILKKNRDKLITIPMKGNLERSLNLSNSVNIILFEALRQLDFPFYDE